MNRFLEPDDEMEVESVTDRVCFSGVPDTVEAPDAVSPIFSLDSEETKKDWKIARYITFSSINMIKNAL